MARVLILTQGDLAELLVEAAETIAGTPGRLSALCLTWDDDLETGGRKLAAKLAELDGTEGSGEGVLVLTDMPGGTPYNVATRFVEPGRLAVVSGVNLPMVVRVCCPGCNDSSVESLAAWLVEKGRQSICEGAPNGSTGDPAGD
ncbi:MAG: PTS sugar transporter subunit IIA [Thermoanaerobaculia bacterium]